jgi:hypothetical protein
VGTESILGIELPFNARLGFGCSVDFLFDDSEIDTGYVFNYLGTPSTNFHPRIYNLGGRIGIGYRISQVTNVGMNLRICNEWNKQDDGSAVVSKESTPYVEIRAGMLKEDPKERYILGLYASYSNAKQYYLDEEYSSVYRAANPFSLSGSLAWEMLWPMYLTMDFALDMHFAGPAGHDFTVVTTVHPWLDCFLRLRAGFIYSHSTRDRGINIGSGFLAGFSWLEEDVDGFRLDLEYRGKPRFLPIDPSDYVIEHFIFLGVAIGIIL